MNFDLGSGTKMPRNAVRGVGNCTVGHSIKALCTLQSKVFVSHFGQLVNTHKLDKVFMIVAKTNCILTRQSELKQSLRAALKCIGSKTT